jgi:hypothetical protein
MTPPLNPDILTRDALIEVLKDISLTLELGNVDATDMALRCLIERLEVDASWFEVQYLRGTTEHVARQ